MSLDESVCEELLNVRTVVEIPVSDSCIPSKSDVMDWPHFNKFPLEKCNVPSSSHQLVVSPTVSFLTIITLAVDQTTELNVNGGSISPQKR